MDAGAPGDGKEGREARARVRTAKASPSPLAGRREK